MTDPLKLAEEIESSKGDVCAACWEAYSCCTVNRSLIAAALRLAHVIDEAHRGLVDRHPIRMYGMAGLDGQAALDAYRKARDGAK